MPYRPKIKTDANGTLSDLPLDAETLGNYTKKDIRDGVIFYTSTGTAAVTSSPYTASLWKVTVDDRFPTTLYTGLTIVIKVPIAGNGTYGTLLTTDGGTTYHPVCVNVNTMVSTRYAVGCMVILTYDATQTATAYYNKSSATTYTGVWKIADYDSNTTITYGTIAYYLRPYTAQAVYRYKLVMLDKDNRLVPLTITNVANGTVTTNQTPTSLSFKPDKIYWYNTTTTISAGAAIGGNTLMSNGYNANNSTNGGMNICNFNESIPAYRMIYLCGRYDATTGLFTLRDAGVASSKNYYTLVPNNTANITLSSYFTSGYDYILLGATYSSATYMHLREDNIMYRFDGTNLVPYETYVGNKNSNDIGVLQDSLESAYDRIDGIEEDYYLASNPNGYTSNAGTVTSVRVQAGTGLSSSTSTAQSTSLNTTISIASGYKLPTTTEWNGKQAALVSGTNIKTINGTSILGSGNITISSGSGKTHHSTWLYKSGTIEVVIHWWSSTVTTAVTSIDALLIGLESCQYRTGYTANGYLYFGSYPYPIARISDTNWDYDEDDHQFYYVTFQYTRAYTEAVQEFSITSGSSGYTISDTIL